jgi:alkaline phosphatase D
VWAVDTRAGLLDVATVEAAPAAGGAVHVEVLNLAPQTEHRFAFIDSDGKRSRTGRFFTAPPDDVKVPVVFGASACTKNGFDMGVMGAAGAREDLAFFVSLGDTVYCDGARTLDDFRGRWSQNLSTDGYRALRGSTSLFATWDDHEVTNNWDPASTPATSVAFGRETFFAHQPLGRVAGTPDRIWKKKRWGKTLELFILDSRSDRHTAGASREYLSRAQMDWLKADLLASDAVFKVIVNSVPISEFPHLFGLFRDDRWEAYPRARDEILGFIEGSQIPGVLWLAGDFHMASVGKVSQSGFGKRAHEVLVGPGAQIPNLLAGLLRAPQFSWASAENNYGALHLDPDRGSIRVVHHNRKNEIIADHELQLA